MHLAYLDGLRGFAAVYVILYHARQFFYYSHIPAAMPRWLDLVGGLLTFGDYIVCVFIVLSGYCLMIPVARSKNKRLSGGIRGFLLRRSRRILPPYYACLTLTSLAIAFVPSLRHATGTLWDIALPALTPGSLLSHAILVHNLFPSWRWTFDPPLWSVGLEWQMYFVFALILLPIWRKFGVGALLSISLLIGLVPLAFGGAYLFSWYVTAFALGMFAARINFSGDSREQRLIDKPAWLATAGLIFLGALVANALSSRRFEPRSSDLAMKVVSELLVAAATAMFLAGTTRRIQGGAHRPALVRLFESRAAAAAGSFSYSLYLIHYPLLALFYSTVTPIGLPAGFKSALFFLVFLPAILLIAYIFHLCFELPFLRTR